ncbi:hypothetical protein NKG94_43840 [Micromonospora sp. M12]
MALLGLALAGCGGTGIGPGGEAEPDPAEIVESWTSCARAAPRAGEMTWVPNTASPPAVREPRIGRIDPRSRRSPP